MKYIDAEKLIAEIERELSAHDKVDHLEAFEVGKAWNRGHRKALENIRSFINSLQQEQPEVDLEKEIDKEWENCCPIDEGMGDESALLIVEQFHQIARHFYELGLNARKP